MTVWMIWVRAEDGAVWIEAAWDDDMTAEDGSGWRAEVDRVAEMCRRNKGYEMRIQRVTVPGVHDLFAIPSAVATTEASS